MITKKYKLTLAALCLMLSTVSFGQSDTAKYWKNPSYVSQKDSKQFNEFAVNTNPYPARPKDMWEIGLGAGVAVLSGDLRNDPGFGWTLTARKSLSHVFSLRPYYSYYTVSGNSGNIQRSIYPNATPFKTRSWGLGIDGIASLNTIRAYRGNPKFNIYVLAGFGVFFNSVRKDWLEDGNYTQWYGYVPFGTLGSVGVQDPTGATDQRHRFIIPTFNIGGGFGYKLNDRINFALEGKNSLTNYDWLDGFYSPYSNAFDSYWFSSFRVNYNIGKKSKNIQPLWWVNPNNYVYNELTQPDHLKNKLKVKMDDADGDGIADQFDLDPNTPAGVAVDSHGRPIDSDGDGIPDYKDKELLTRQECFPVDADGKGTCPENPCCKTSKEKIEILQRTIDSIRSGSISTKGGGNSGCGLDNLPSIVFGGGNSLNRDNMKLLDAVAAQMKSTPGCKLKVVGHPEASNKKEQQKAYDRVASIIKYLVDKQGISESRFIFAYDGGNGDGNTIDLEGTTEEGPNTVPAPAPHLRNK